jgi:predicted lipoprotein with Yx(FWY)xxD motif
VASSSELGEILVDGSGRTLYLFEADKEGSSTCYDKCAQV